MTPASVNGKKAKRAEKASRLRAREKLCRVWNSMSAPA
jgi:muconolactone delta-isomerase